MPKFWERGVITFSESYPRLREQCVCAREDSPGITEQVLQWIWHTQHFRQADLAALEGQHLRIVAPGQWNRSAGPDFRRAQIAFNGKAFTGDVEVHFTPTAWEVHGHHRDPRYEDVILHVVLDAGAKQTSAVTFSGRSIPTLVLRPLLTEDLDQLAQRASYEAPRGDWSAGACSALIPAYGAGALENFLRLAGEWRILNKMRELRTRMDRVGADQALYEAFLYGCGFGQFKEHLGAIARHLPYARAQQLAHQDPLLLEAALLQLAGLLPDCLPEDTSPVPHFARLNALRAEKLPGLKRLPLEWRRTGVRPNNYPERRLAGAAAFIARTSQPGLAKTMHGWWQDNLKSVARRRTMERLFPTGLGFWSTHCSWTGKRLPRCTAPLGPGRVRSIIGNVFVPAGLALAREARDVAMEERVFTFFCALPPEPDNAIVKAMLPRVLGEAETLKMSFRMQQGLLQMYYDWCEPNPSCQNCGLLRYLEREAKGIAPPARMTPG